MAAFDAGTSAAKRRRKRRLRSWWRHGRMSIAAVLATVSHHSYPKVDTTPEGARSLAPAPRWVLPSILSSPRTMAGPPGGSGQWHCLSRCRGGRCSGTQASGTKSSESRCSCAADGGTAAECHSVLCRAFAGGCRAGYRSANDLA